MNRNWTTDILKQKRLLSSLCFSLSHSPIILFSKICNKLTIYQYRSFIIYTNFKIEHLFIQIWNLFNRMSTSKQQTFPLFISLIQVSTSDHNSISTFISKSTFTTIQFLNTNYTKLEIEEVCKVQIIKLIRSSTLVM